MRAKFRTAFRKVSIGTDEKPKEEYVYLSDALAILEDIESEYDNLVTKTESAIEDITKAMEELKTKLA